MKPTVGRIVHFFEDDGDQPLPAIVTQVHSESCVNLHVFSDVGNPDRQPCEGSVMRAIVGDKTKRKWVWPPVPFRKSDGKGNED